MSVSDIKMKYLLVAYFAVVAQCCLFAAAAHAHGDPDSVLEAALRPLYSQLDVFREQLDAVKLLVHVPCKKDVLECSEVGPLGMEDGRIPDASITASSMWNNQANHGPTRARLNHETASAAAWCIAVPNETDPWIQVDFSCSVIITGVITQGRGDRSYDQWVTEFKVAYSDDGQEWTDVTNDGSCTPTKFPGNSDKNTQVTTTFPKAFKARFLRILPTQYELACCMRFEVLGYRIQE
ncbi:lactadherin-like isoform X1 [Patiria miniata]|uniref:F5/8 type C domain-containing protein n=1 Tax=Patiria miniata TaxID=46514 RepID=A0A914A9F3_PATMI|nr:lactadherin-like isoform X1 [Patiria miniata]